MNYHRNVLLLTLKKENVLIDWNSTFESIFGFCYCCLCISYIGYLLINLLSFGGRRDSTFGKKNLTTYVMKIV